MNLTTIKNKQTSKTPSFNNVKAKGEPYVWLTAMGLGVGLLMVVLLLGVIAINGISVFWPKKLVEITLTEQSDMKINGSNKIAGHISKKQIRKNGKKEWQLYVGNKDVYGFSFKFVDKDKIVSVERPKNIMSIERLEYGDAIGVPLWLKVKNVGEFAAGTKEFDRRLKTLIKGSHQLWAHIKQIEKKEIGKINRQMQSLALKKKVIGSKKEFDLVEKDKLFALDNKIELLQRDYQILAQQAQDLRVKVNEHTLGYRLVTGEEKVLPIGHIIHTVYPNKLNVWQQTKLFFYDIWHFLADDPREANTEGGVFPAIFGTFVMTVLMSMAVTPFGVLAAIYLREYAKQGLFVRCVRISVNNLAGVPSIVFGVFGLGFFIYFVGGTLDQIFFKSSLPTPTFGTGGIFWASLTLALMTVPVVIVSTEEALAAVSQGSREGSLACGASKWQTIQRVILPASAPGILTGLILAMARGAGEVAPLMLVGVVKLAPSLPLDSVAPFVHLDRKFMHLGFHIYDLGFQSPDSEAAKPMVFATTFLLIVLVVLLNLAAIIIRERLRRRYATSAF